MPAPSSNYNGLIATLTHRQRYLTLQLNYAYSHALDEISNGGFLPFGGNSNPSINPQDLAQHYGNADYDTRNYISGSYVLTFLTGVGRASWLTTGRLPVPCSTIMAIRLVNPMPVRSTNFGLVNYSSPLVTRNRYRLQLDTAVARTMPSIECSTRNGRYVGTPCGYSATNYRSRHQLTDCRSAINCTVPTTPMPTWMSPRASRSPGLESGNLKLGAQFFNLFNHPNFSCQPYHDDNNGLTARFPDCRARRPRSWARSWAAILHLA